MASSLAVEFLPPPPPPPPAPPRATQPSASDPSSDFSDTLRSIQRSNDSARTDSTDKSSSSKPADRSQSTSKPTGAVKPRKKSKADDSQSDAAAAQDAKAAPVTPQVNQPAKSDDAQGGSDENTGSQNANVDAQAAATAAQAAAQADAAEAVTSTQAAPQKSNAPAQAPVIPVAAKPLIDATAVGKDATAEDARAQAAPAPQQAAAKPVESVDATLQQLVRVAAAQKATEQSGKSEPAKPVTNASEQAGKNAAAKKDAVTPVQKDTSAKLPATVAGEKIPAKTAASEQKNTDQAVQPVVDQPAPELAKAGQPVDPRTLDPRLSLTAKPASQNASVHNGTEQPDYSAAALAIQGTANLGADLQDGGAGDGEGSSLPSRLRDNVNAGGATAAKVGDAGLHASAAAAPTTASASAAGDAKPGAATQPIAAALTGAAAAHGTGDAAVPMDRLTDTLSAHISSDRWHVSMQLDPPELGKLRLDVSMQDDGLSVRMQVGSEDVRRMVESRMPDLVHALGDHDLHVAHAQVNVRESASSQFDSNPQHREGGAQAAQDQAAGRQNASGGREDGGAESRQRGGRDAAARSAAADPQRRSVGRGGRVLDLVA